MKIIETGIEVVETVVVKKTVKQIVLEVDEASFLRDCFAMMSQSSLYDNYQKSRLISGKTSLSYDDFYKKFYSIYDGLSDF